MVPIQLSAAASLFHADCREAIRALPDNSLDSVVTDPPYELNFMGKGWDNTGIANDPALWAEVYRVLKPGGHCAAFSASRTYHRMACAIEDAGFEIRDSLMWVYGTGFPKSLDVAKALDKSAGHWRGRAGEVIERSIDQVAKGTEYSRTDKGEPITAAAAAAWEGWGTALKPAFEPIVLARKPLSEGTVAANVLRWRTGALNIGASRIGTTVETWPKSRSFQAGISKGYTEGLDAGTTQATGAAPAGRWPANVVHDGSDEVVGAFPFVKARGNQGNSTSKHDSNIVFGKYNAIDCGENYNHEAAGTVGSAARFFYSAKASKADRNGSKHPTVKPIALMEWLATLITPPGGTILDPFAGSGTTGIAATRRGFQVVLVEREAEYVRDIQARFSGAPAAPGRRIYGTFADKSGQNGTIARLERPLLDLTAFRREALAAQRIRAFQAA